MKPKNNIIGPVMAGLILILLGVLLNEAVLLEIFSNRKALTQDDIPKIYGWVINAIRIASILLGVWFIYKRSNPRFIGLSSNLLLSLISVGLVLVVFEVMFKAYLPNIPLGIQPLVDEHFSIICQSSKKEPVAKDYIAIMGDSYAWGAGDWHLDSDPKSNEAFHSAHVIQNKLQRDVLSLGKPGASSITGLLAHPDVSLRKLRYRYEIEDPQVILYYFYEGNDLTDNLRDIKLRTPNYFEFANTKQVEKASFTEYINNQILTAPDGEKTAAYLIGTKFIKNIALSLIKPRKDEPEDLSYDGPNSYNMVAHKDTVFQLPNRMQNPALNLTETELQQSLDIMRFSLELMTERFSEAKIYLVYIPSVLSCYQLQGPVSVQGLGEEDAIYSKDQLEQRSNYLVEEIGKYCRDLNIKFINPRDHIRQHTKNDILHGPKDWDHLNKQGYELLGEFVVDNME